jgi:hypothetical protein
MKGDELGGVRETNGERREMDGSFVRKLAVNLPLGRTRHDGKILLISLKETR